MVGTVEQCCHRNLELDRQPVGTGGEALGVMALVVLKITVDGAVPHFMFCAMYYSPANLCGRVSYTIVL